MTRRGWALFAAMCLIWGIPYLLIRVAVGDMSPGTLVFCRTALGGLVLIPLALRGGGYRQVLPHWRPLITFTLIEIAIPWMLLGDAEQHLPSSLTGLLVAAVPLVGVLIARLMGTHEPISAAGWAGLVLGLLGVGLLVGLDLHGLSARSLVEMALVVCGYATAPAIISRYLSDVPSVPVVSASLLLAAVGWAPYAITHWPGHLAATGTAAVITLGLVCTALAFVLFFALTAEIGPMRAPVITYVNPAVAIAAGLIFLHERFTAGMGVGFPLILLGSVLATQRRVPQTQPDAATQTTPTTRTSAAAACPESGGLTQPTAPG